MSEPSERLPAECFPPGEILAEELDERAWSTEEAAWRLGWPIQVLEDVLKGELPILQPQAEDLSRVLGTSASSWLNMQAAYDRFRKEEGPPTDRAWRDYSDKFREQTWPNLIESAIFLHIGETWTKDDDPLNSIQAATQIGYCLLLDKPLLVLVPKGQVPSQRLVRAADVIVYDVDMNDPTTQDRIHAALVQLGVEL